MTAWNASEWGVTLFGFTVGTIDAGVGNFGGVAAVLADDADHAGADLFRELKRGDEVGRDVLLQVAAADGENEQSVLALSREPRSHSTNTLAQPSSLVRAVSSETLSVGA